MTQSRDAQVALEATPFYHCYVRCVRRAYLCGNDFSTGENFDHRKQWIVSRLKFLSYVYAIDICAYAVMSNHYHVVLHVDKARAEAWSQEEVVERWMQLYKGNLLVDKWIKERDSLDKATLQVVETIIEDWRTRLFDISWFMRGVNETIARMANEEDNVKGRFWEGRFKSQALLDEVALLSCMAYVDLNPVRADVADDLTSSDFTSVQQRLFEISKERKRKATLDTALVARVEVQEKLKDELGVQGQPEAPLMAFSGSVHTPIHSALPFAEADYLELVDKTGRVVREDKRGFIKEKIPRLVSQYNLDPEQWLKNVKQFHRRYGRAAGSVEKMKKFAESFVDGLSKTSWCKGMGVSRMLYQ